MRRSTLSWGVCALLLAGAAMGAGCRTQAAPSPAAPTSAPAMAQPAPPARSAPAVAAVLSQRAAAAAPAFPPRATTEPASTPHPPPPATADPIADFIASLEAQYHAALGLYNQGQWDEARQGFDATLDRLLASNYDIRATPRLQTEYDSLLDRMHALESDVLPAGGLTQAQAQATPLESVPELTFPLDAATRALIESDARSTLAGATTADELPLVLNDAVIRYVHYFTTTGREDLIEGFRRAGRYRAMVDRIFRAQGVPTDLIYLAQLESDFDPRLVSSAGARGMWQFMAARADDYGLQRTAWVDQRQDPERETMAAARHLKDLHAEFGDWYLAMAAYNTGPRTMQEIVARTGYADYWKLYDLGVLPRYVRDYVPVILAMALIARSPEQYGLGDLQEDTPILSDTTHLEAAVDLRLAAECAQVTVGDLQHLNPSLLHLRAPAGFDLALPQGSGSRFAQALARVPPPADRLQWRLHWVQPGETWGQLSRRYGMGVGRLAAANHLASTQPLPPDTPLALPLGPAPRRAARQTAKKSLTSGHL